MKKEINIQKNDVYNIKIEDLTQTGYGVGKINGFAVFVENSIPGDFVEVKILKVKKNLQSTETLNKSYLKIFQC